MERNVDARSGYGRPRLDDRRLRWVNYTLMSSGNGHAPRVPHHPSPAPNTEAPKPPKNAQETMRRRSPCIEDASQGVITNCEVTRLGRQARETDELEELGACKAVWAVEDVWAVEVEEKESGEALDYWAVGCSTNPKLTGDEQQDVKEVR